MFGTKLCALVAAFFAIVVGDAYAQTAGDSATLRYRVAKPAATPYEPVRPASNIGLKDPSNFTNEVEYDEETDQYIIHQRWAEWMCGRRSQCRVRSMATTT